MKTFKYIKSYIFFVSFFIFSILVNSVSAATLIFSPANGTYTKGSSITVNVLVSSSDKTMNAASGVISFPPDLLSVSAISKTGSIVGFWAQEPTFSNANGTISFEGVVLPPWFTGSSGKILTITFKSKEVGTAPLSFVSGSVLAADGAGTDIMLGTGAASYIIKSSKGEPIIIPPAEDTGVPGAPEILSNTHADSNKWYPLSNANFSWQLTKDIIASSVLIGKIAKSSPTVLYDPPINSKEVGDLNDGVWYFHVQLKNSEGWGSVSHFKLQIDTEKPTIFDITEVKRADPTDPNAIFIFNASDKTSGIDHYEIQIDNGPVLIWKDTGSKTYETPATEGGTHTMFVKAVDKAGNYITNSVSFITEGLEAPRITDYPSEIRSGEILAVEGTTKYVNTEVTLFLQDEKGGVKKYSAKVDKDGNFTVVSGDRLKDGIYSAWVQIIDGRGAKSLSSEKVTIAVRQSAIIIIGNWAIGFLAILIPLIALILLLIFLIWYGWHRFFIIGKKLKKEVREAEDALHKAFDLLKESIGEQIKILEKTKTKRQLTAEEEKINRQLKKDLEDAEAYIRKEIEDIENLVETSK